MLTANGNRFYVLQKWSANVFNLTENVHGSSVEYSFTHKQREVSLVFLYSRLPSAFSFSPGALKPETEIYLDCLILELSQFFTIVKGAQFTLFQIFGRK
jgi:hypothetical protein